MTRSTPFTSNGHQAVPLPKPVVTPEGLRQVETVRLGRSRPISPAGHTWDAFFDAPGVSEDFMAEEEQPKVEKREGF